MSVGQVSRSNIAGWFWVGVSHEVAAKLLAGNAVSEGLTEAGESASNQDGSLTWLLA